MIQFIVIQCLIQSNPILLSVVKDGLNEILKESLELLSFVFGEFKQRAARWCGGQHRRLTVRGFLV